MNSQQTERRARKPLSRDRIISAAVQLADQNGSSGVSMRALGSSLGVEAMSLYHYVANREQLLDGMVDAVFAEIWLPAPEAEWRESMRRHAESARETLNRHRWAVSLMDSRKHPGPATLRHHDAVLGCLRGNGFTVPQAAHAISVLDSYVYGFVLQEAALPFTTSEELDELAESIFAELPKDEFPHFTELAVEQALKPGYSYSDEFDFGVTLILDGLSRIRTP
ncbi:TetR/AcrR family transcriptional regulator [Nesterenkonia rhizosphaerae]|uniref:TetR/AcrR family transcriptional regulator C-terminal domain-containing protein n=1 Tax=Nesterenkonia rhizosphaerae TaxID=1348272 RepID=A0ABP9FR61_9MICC